MSRARCWAGGLLAWAALTLAFAPSCVYSPTEIDVRIATAGICDAPRGALGRYQGSVWIFLAREPTIPRTEVPTCEPGRPPSPLGASVGNIVFTPSGASDATIAFEIVEGEGCLAPDGSRLTSAGCVTARREVTFRPHERVDVPVVLREECRGNPCSPSTTCTIGGTCVPATCIGLACGDAPVDAGAEAAPPPPPLPLPDAASDATPDVSLPPVDCGAVGVRCPGSGVCLSPTKCCNQSGAASACAASCPGAANNRLACDDVLDCAALAGTVCCLRKTAQGIASSCEADCNGGVVMCGTCPRGDNPCAVGVCTTTTCEQMPVSVCGGVCPN